MPAWQIGSTHGVFGAPVAGLGTERRTSRSHLKQPRGGTGVNGQERILEKILPIQPLGFPSRRYVR